MTNVSQPSRLALVIRLVFSVTGQLIIGVLSNVMVPVVVLATGTGISGVAMGMVAGGLLAVVLALGVLAPHRRALNVRKRYRRYGPAALSCAIVGVCFVGVGVFILNQKIPSRDTFSVSHQYQLALIELNQSGKNEADVHAFLIATNRELSRRHGMNAQTRIELAFYDDTAKCLRLTAPWCIDGWPHGVIDRVFGIPGLTPGGIGSVAGDAWLNRQQKYVPNGLDDPTYHLFQDAIERANRPSLSVLATPIMGGSANALPIGVITLASPNAAQFSEADLIFADVVAKVLQMHFARQKS